MNTYKSWSKCEFAVMRGSGCGVSSLWVAGNTEVELLQLDHEQFYITYRDVRQLFSVPAISSQGSTAFQLRFRKENSY